MTSPTPYTLEDHRRDPLTYPMHGKCGIVWHQRGNLTGHCSRCCETFEGTTAFDAHQRIQKDGSVVCLHPSEAKVQKTALELIKGSWRGPRMSEEDVERRFRSKKNSGTSDG